MIRKKNRFVRPKRAYETARIKEENELLKEYALKSKREVWKMQAKVSYFRKRAMALAKAPIEEQQVLFTKLKALGLKTDSLAEVLALKIEDLLSRRLPTIVFKNNLSKSPQHARQMVVHKKVMINGNVNNTPSYLVPVSEENKITLKINKKQPKVAKAEPATEVKAEVPAEEAKQ
jgi:small subunit ribosomal protein S4